MLNNFLKKILSSFYKWFFILYTDRLVLISFFFKTIFKPNEFLYKVDGSKFWVRKNSSDISIIQEVYKKRVYGKKPKGVVFDIGANIGAFSIYASSTSSKVYAFEPELSNYKQLVKNICLNKRSKKIKAFKIAVGNENKKVLIYNGKFNKGISSVMFKITNKSEVVEMKRLSDLIDELGIQKVDLLKIDIEGKEYDLIYGLPKQKFEKIDKIVLEFHYIDKESYIELKNYLVSIGYKTNIYRGLRDFLVGTGIIKAEKKKFTKI